MNVLLQVRENSTKENTKSLVKEIEKIIYG